MHDRSGRGHRLDAYTSTLGWSRMHCFVRSPTRARDDLLACMADDTRWLGGVPAEWLTDDMPAVATLGGDGRRSRDARDGARGMGTVEGGGADARCLLAPYHRPASLRLAVPMGSQSRRSVLGGSRSSPRRSAPPGARGPSSGPCRRATAASSPTRRPWPPQPASARARCASTCFGASRAPRTRPPRTSRPRLPSWRQRVSGRRRGGHASRWWRWGTYGAPRPGRRRRLPTAPGWETRRPCPSRGSRASRNAWRALMGTEAGGGASRPSRP
jgi:hypothetical protein